MDGAGERGVQMTRNDLIRIYKKNLISATSLRYRFNYAVPHSKLERHLHSSLALEGEPA